MGLGAVALLVKGHLNEEMPRYLYQRLRSCTNLSIHEKLCLIKTCRWAKKGVTEESSWMFCFEMQKEILVQVTQICKCALLSICQLPKSSMSYHYCICVVVLFYALCNMSIVHFS